MDPEPILTFEEFTRFMGRFYRSKNIPVDISRLSVDADLVNYFNTNLKFFKKEKALAKWYANLSEAIRRDFARSMDDVKSTEARERRAEQGVERLMLTMEAEKVLPPIIEIALRGNARARAGWERMTTVQRRGHLLGVFYYQSPEARQRRVQKLMEECLRVAGTGK